MRLLTASFFVGALFRACQTPALAQATTVSVASVVREAFVVRGFDDDRTPLSKQQNKTLSKTAHAVDS